MGKYIERVRQSFGGMWRERPRFANNPIIMRELITQLRRKQSFGYLFLFLTLTSLVFVFYWRQYTQSNMWHIWSNGRSVMTALGVTQGLALLLFAPILSAVSINLERERETWDLLLTSPISLASILAGKLISSFLFVGLILASMVPIVSMTVTMGGVSPQEIALIYLALGESLGIASLIGLYCSIRWKKAVQSITFTYIICFTYFWGLFYIPLIFLHRPVFLFLLSPFYPFSLVANPSISNNILGLLYGQYSLHIHFAFMSLIAVFLLCACFVRLLPRSRERALNWLNNKCLAIGTFVGKPWFLIAGTWAAIAIGAYVSLSFAEPIVINNYTLYFIQIITTGFLLLFLPLAAVSYFQLQWEKKPWDEVGSTPSKLERMIYRLLLHPVKTYGKYVLGVLLFYLIFFAVSPHTVQSGIWHLLFMADAVLYIAVVGMASSLIARNVIHACMYCYSILLFIFSLLPITTSHFFCTSVSPIYMAFAPHIDQRWNRPFSELSSVDVLFTRDFFHVGNLTIHFAATLVFFILTLLFCQKRLLTVVGQFERESLWGWIKRNLWNRKPKVSNVPSGSLIPYLPNRINPVAVRELREFFVHQSAKSLKTTVWIFLSGVFLFWLFPIVGLRGLRIYKEAIVLLGFALFLAPFFIVPFAASSFRKERDQSTWDLISTTLLSSEKMIRGKWFAGFCLFHVRYIVFLSPVFFIGTLFWAYGGSNYEKMGFQFFAFIAVGYPFFLFMQTFSTYASRRFNKTTAAYIVSLLVPYTIMIAPILSVAFIGQSLESSAFFSPISLLILSLDQIQKPMWVFYLIAQTVAFLVLSRLFYVRTYRLLNERE